MATNRANITQFTSDECYIYPGNTGDANFFGLQKTTINSSDGFCYNPYGQVSNIDCPDWDPGCNCYISQYRPTQSMVSDSQLFEYKKNLSECKLIKTHLVGVTDPSDWFGIDMNNPNSCFNCVYKESGTSELSGGIKKIRYLGVTGSFDPAATKFPYTRGLFGISGPVIRSKLEPNSSSRDDEGTEKLSNWSTKINGPLFSNYLEYSKTNATFWNTPPKTPLLRRAQMALYGAQKIKILVNGDFNHVYVGGLVNIEIPIAGESNNSASYPSHKRFAGTWMVYRIERFINASKHTMNLFLMRDGLYPYNKPTDINIYKNTVSVPSDQ